MHRKPGRWQFSLRVMAGGVLAIGLACGIYKWMERQYVSAINAMQMASADAYYAVPGQLSEDALAALRMPSTPLPYPRLTPEGGGVGGAWDAVMAGKAAVYENRRFDEHELSHLRTVPGIRAVALRECVLTDQDIKSLGAIDSAQYLALIRASCAREDLACISGMDDLRFVDLAMTAAPVETLAWLGQLRRLQTLRLDAAGVNDAGLAAVCSSKCLRELNLSSELQYFRGHKNVITREGVASIARIESLEVLNLDDNELSDAAIEPLLTLRGLRSLSLRDNPISVDVVRALLAACRALRKVHMDAPDPQQLAAVRAEFPNVEITVSEE